MTWVNGETKLNAANMNNIMMGIDEAIQSADGAVHKGSAAQYSNEDIYGTKTIKSGSLKVEDSTAGAFVVVNSSHVDIQVGTSYIEYSSGNI